MDSPKCPKCGYATWFIKCRRCGHDLRKEEDDIVKLENNGHDAICAERIIKGDGICECGIEPVCDDSK
jgi:hypothetical protein